jgi:hypothetical protein
MTSYSAKRTFNEHFSCVKSGSQKSIWHLVDLHTLLAWVSGPDYLYFLWKQWSGLWDDASFNGLLHSCFQHDGAPTHLIGEVRQLLFANYSGRWIGRGCEDPVSWPPRSPDLNPLYCFLLWYLKTKICASRFHTTEEVLRRFQHLHVK